LVRRDGCRGEDVRFQVDGVAANWEQRLLEAAGIRETSLAMRIVDPRVKGFRRGFAQLAIPTAKTTGMADENGRAYFLALPFGQHRLRVVTADHDTIWKVFEVTPHKTTTITMRLKRRPGREPLPESHLRGHEAR
jgi:hypothetical protein